MDESNAVDGGSGDTFGALSHELRLVVLDVLDRAQETTAFAGESVPFSELVDRIESRGVEGFDESNFNYHLRVLRDAEFIRRTDDGYQIRQAGVRIVRALRAGDISHDVAFEKVPIDEPCPYCGGTSAISLRDDWLVIQCLDCHGAFVQYDRMPAGTLAAFEVSPAGIRDRSPREIFDVGFQLGQRVHRLFAAGICPECSGPTETELLEICTDHALDESGICDSCGRTTDEFVVVSCEVCHRSLVTFPAIIVASNPHVVAVMYERGRNITDQTWTVLSSPPDWPSQYARRDPVVVEYTIPVPDGDPIRVRIDEQLDVSVCNS